MTMKTVLKRIAATFAVVFVGAAVASAQAPAKQPAVANIDKGDFKVGFSPLNPDSKKKKAMPTEISDLLKEIAAPLNELIALPADVHMNFDQCGEPNAFYSPTTREITMCYEFITYFEEVFTKGKLKPAEIEQRVNDVAAFFFFHELGHCLIDVWDLPATGREEDAVDQLATLILLDGTPEGADSVISAAIFFALASADRSKDDIAFWDEHSVDEQRMYDSLCLTFGSDPAKHKNIVANGFLPAERAERCSDEFKRIDRAWERLLTPYLKVQ